MTARQQAFFWLGAGIALVALLALLGDILLPFVLGTAIAYLLDPLADRLERVGLSRLWSTIIIVSGFGLLILAGLLYLVPLLAEQLVGLAGRFPSYVQGARDILLSYYERWLGDMSETADTSLQKAATEVIDNATAWVGKLIGSVWSGGLAIVNTLALFIVTPVVAFYLLLDWDRMVNHLDQWLPRDHAPTIRALSREIDDVIAGFVRGQITVLLLLGTIYVIGLTAIGLNFGLLIGVSAGLISFIPYLGPIVGFLIGGTVAVVQFGTDWLPIAGVVGVFLLGQIIEGNVLSPLIVGESVGLHPVWLIFALFVFAYLFGFVGMLLAVPIAAAIGVLVRFALRQYLDSSLYYGSTRAPARKNADAKRVSRQARKS